MSIKGIISRIAIIILIVETLIMLMLDSLPYTLSALEETAIDSFLLVCMSTPVIYIWVVLPYKVEREKEQNYLFQRSRMVQMGEMLSMISHQWRQPLSAISARAMKTKLMIELEYKDMCTTEENKRFTESILEDLDQIDIFVQGLSSTINDFRDFYKPNKEVSLISLKTPIVKALNIVRDSFTVDGIQIMEKYDSEKKLTMHASEIMQVVLNILKNAQDNFKEKDTQNPQIIISTINNKTNVILEICDNGGGINEEILPKIFDPYFSTKYDKNGTGLGLYMSKTIIETHHDGSFIVENRAKGACFIIKFNT